MLPLQFAEGQSKEELDSGFFFKVEAAQNDTAIDISQEGNDIMDDNDGAIEGMLEADQARVMVTKTTVVPFRYIGFLRSKDGTRCTGALITPRHVLTAGHCVFDYRGTQQLRDRQPIFWPALSNNMSTIDPAQAPYGSFRVINIKLPVEFVAADSNQAYDVAVLTLETNASDVGGFFPKVGCTDAEGGVAADAQRPLTADSAQGRRLKYQQSPRIAFKSRHGPEPLEGSERSLLSAAQIAGRASSPSKLSYSDSISRDSASGPANEGGDTGSNPATGQPVSNLPAPPPAAAADVNSTRRAFRLNVAGYPADQDREMWAAFCGDIVLFPRDVVLIQHECNTFSGMSGSPLWRYKGGSDRSICAVHKADAIVEGVENLAVPLYRELVAFIQIAVATL